MKKKYVVEKGRCDFCGHVTRVELFYNYSFKKEKYACKECAETLDNEWVRKAEWDMPSDVDGEEAVFIDPWW